MILQAIKSHQTMEEIALQGQKRTLSAWAISKKNGI